MSYELQLAQLAARMTGVGNWLATSQSHHLAESRHLDQGTAEAAYWHAGYHQALADAVRMLSAETQQSGNEDIANRFRLAALDAENCRMA